jgi:hypothetical protein
MFERKIKAVRMRDRSCNDQFETRTNSNESNNNKQQYTTTTKKQQKENFFVRTTLFFSLNPFFLLVPLVGQEAYRSSLAHVHR